MDKILFQEKYKELYKERLWYELGNLFKLQAKDNHNECLKYIDSFLSIVHPLTATDVIIALIESAEENEDLSKILKYSEFSNIQRNYDELKIAIRISYLKYLVKFNKLENVESEIYSLSKIRHTSVNRRNYELLIFNYYYKINNYEEAVKYISENANIEDVCIAAVLALNYFDFTRIISFESFNQLLGESSSDIKNLILSLAEDDKQIDLNVKGLNSELLLLKYNLISILMVVRSSSTPKISFDVFLEKFKFSDEDLILLLLKSFELGIINGWIDSEKRIFNCTEIIPKVLNNSEILGLKERIDVIKSKVSKVISIMSNK